MSEEEMLYLLEKLTNDEAFCDRIWRTIGRTQRRKIVESEHRFDEDRARRYKDAGVWGKLLFRTGFRY